jgi:hypothetical protein
MSPRPARCAVSFRRTPRRLSAAEPFYKQRRRVLRGSASVFCGVLEMPLERGKVGFGHHGIDLDREKLVRPPILRQSLSRISGGSSDLRLPVGFDPLHDSWRQRRIVQSLSDCRNLLRFVPQTVAGRGVHPLDHYLLQMGASRSYSPHSRDSLAGVA